MTSLAFSILVIMQSILMLFSEPAAYTPSYKVYTALLNQSGTSAPTATVLENTLSGDIVWSRDEVGQYLGTLNGAFTANKTMVFKDIQEVSGDTKYAKAYAGGVNFITLYTYDNPVDATDMDLDGIIVLEIRVYP